MSWCRIKIQACECVSGCYHAHMARRKPWRWYSDLTVGNKIAIFAIAVPFICTIIGGTYFLLTNDSNLELVDVGLKEDGPTTVKEDGPTTVELDSPATVVDIELRNTGRKVAYLKEANVNVEKTWKLQSNIFPRYVGSSHNYDVLLAPTGAPYTKTKDLEQEVIPDKGDRFTFTIGLDPPRIDPGNIQYVFLVALDLIYDEDNKIVSSKKLLIVDLPTHDPKYYFFPNAPANSVFERWHNHNLEVLDEIRAIESTKSKDLKTLIRNAPRENQ
jgi:hypothetical protein